MKPRSEPLFSVITATYNSAATIGDTLDSVIAQEYRNVEHIIVDGMSGDETPAIVGRYAEEHPNIRMIRGKDRGVYDALNKGIAESRGDFLYFMGSDDRFFDERVLSDLASSGLMQKQRVIYGNVMIVGDTGWAKDGQIYDGPFNRRKLIRQNICHQAVFYPANLLAKTGIYNIGYKINADWDLNWRCWAEGRFLYFDRIICTFSAGGTSTNTTDFAFKDDYINNIGKYFRYPRRFAMECGRHSPWGDLTGGTEDKLMTRLSGAENIMRILSQRIKRSIGI